MTNTLRLFCATAKSLYVLRSDSQCSVGTLVLSVLSGTRRDMQLLVVQCRHLLKNFQRACLTRTIYTRLSSPYKPFSQILTANFPSSSVAELAPIKNTKRTLTWSVSPPEVPQRDRFRRPRSSEDASTSPRKRGKKVINPGLPATHFGFLVGKFLRHEARSLGFRVLPDGFVRVSEMLHHPQFARFEFQEFIHFLKRDPMDRFELAFLFDIVDGILQKVWWVRAKYGHSMPGVDAANKRIIHVGKLGTVYYITSISDWEYIHEHGIPEGPNHLIPLFVKSRCHLFLDDVPANTKALRISIDPFMAVSLGVKFFHTKSAHLVATGNWDKKIPLKAFNSVVELEFSKETLK